MTEPRVHRIHVEPRPDGLVLELAPEHYEYLLRDVLTLLDERPDLLDDLLALYADEQPDRDRYVPDQPSRDEQLAERIVRALPVASRSVRLHRPAAVRLRDRLSAVVGRRRLGVALGRRWAGWRAA